MEIHWNFIPFFPNLECRNRGFPTFGGQLAEQSVRPVRYRQGNVSVTIFRSLRLSSCNFDLIYLAWHCALLRKEIYLSTIICIILQATQMAELYVYLMLKRTGKCYLTTGRSVQFSQFFSFGLQKGSPYSRIISTE